MTKVALVHDYLNEYGGAEKVLQTLSEMFPEAPIYTAFCVHGSSAFEAFKDKKIISTWFRWIPFYWKLFSPLRFMIPWIWKSVDLSEYDLIISSASWYVTKGFDKKPGAIEVCYCHTPPRWLYGYSTSVDLKKYWIVRVYAAIVGHFLRQYDYRQAQKVDIFVANSKNVQNRIRKYYRRESSVIYPSVDIANRISQSANKRGNYYLMVTRLVGGKGIELASEAAKKYGFKLKIAGETAGFLKISNIEYRISNIEFLGRVSDEEKYKLMAEAKGFLALAQDEDFGITPVEAMGQGTPVVAYNGGGYKETVVDGKNGVLFSEYSVQGLVGAIRRMESVEWDRKTISKSVAHMTGERFKREFRRLVS